MLLKLFRANKFYNFILFPLMGLLLLLRSFLSGGILPKQICANSTPVFQLIFQTGISYTGAVVMNLIVVIIICILLLYFNARFDFVKERTFLPIYIFLFIVYALPELHIIQPVFFSAIFIILSIRSIFLSFEKQSALTSAFDAGFFTGMAGLFYLPASFLIILVPLGIFIMQSKLVWREIILPVVGFILPWIFLISYYFIWKDVGLLFSTLHFSAGYNGALILRNPLVKIYIGFLVVITVIASFFIVNQYAEKSINSRRCFQILSFYFDASLLLLIIPSVSYEIIVLLTIPLTFLITNYFIFLKRKFWAELFLICFMLFPVVLQTFR